ncbi:hypothetical protein P5673_027297 [Acropora cervicornis]|uniref:Uncharacterized protein n=1 Tax=Acropora cervicornis TaxID=6130 RepID=A0AAD9PZ34_ACRCE|nr:hypothetical protein P5673_027297 [Acropora cervicornis]
MDDPSACPCLYTDGLSDELPFFAQARPRRMIRNEKGIDLTEVDHLRPEMEEEVLHDRHHEGDKEADRARCHRQIPKKGSAIGENPVVLTSTLLVPVIDIDAHVLGGDGVEYLYPVKAQSDTMIGRF